MADDKKRSWFDDIAAGYGLRFIKSALRTALPKFGEINPALQLQIAHLFQRGDVADREAFELVARSAVEVIDVLLDRIPFLPTAVKAKFGDLGADTVTEIRDYYTNVKVDFPDTMPKIQGVDMTKEAGLKLKEFIVNVWRKSMESLQKLIATLSGITGISVKNKLNEFLKVLFTMNVEGADGAALKNFNEFFDAVMYKDGSTGEREPDNEALKDFVDLVENFDTFAKFSAYFSKPLPEVIRAFHKARLLKDHTGTQRVERDVRTVIQKAVINGVNPLLDIGNELLEGRQAQRKARNARNRTRNFKIAGVIGALFVLHLIATLVAPGRDTMQNVLTVVMALLIIGIYFWVNRRRNRPQRNGVRYTTVVETRESVDAYVESSET